MDGHTPPWRVVRFGTFEVDREAGELRKRGLHVKVQEQPFRILTVLLDRLGEIVSREELRRILWPDGTFVDFDHSLNAAIAKLRQALSDSAESPRFIETVARRGYRFIGSVEVVEAPAAHGNGTVSSKGERSMPADGVSSPAQVRVSKTRAPSRRHAAIAAILAAAALVGSAWIWTRTKPQPAPATSPLTSYPGYEWHPAFSPDGSQVAFTWNGPGQDNTDIYVAVVGAGEPLRLTNHPGVDDTPAWSPDGRWIAFVRRHPTAPRGDIFVMQALGGGERKIGETAFIDQVIGPTLTWSADSKWLVFKDTPPQRNPGFYRISIETEEVKPFLDSPAVRLGDYAAAFSPDGGRLDDHSLNIYTI